MLNLWNLRALGNGLLFCAAILGQTAVAGDQRPNIVLLFADDLGWTGVSSDALNKGNASRYYQTPHIDKLAAEGICFTSAYTQQNCAPSRAALLSGQYAPRTGVYNVGSLARMDRSERNSTPIIPPENSLEISPDAITLAEVLKSAGYTTVHFGKTHGWGDEQLLTTAHGFDLDMGCYRKVTWSVDGETKSSNYFAARDADGQWIFASESYRKYAQPYTREYVQNALEPVANGNDPMTLVGTPKHFTDAIGDAAIDFIRDHHRNNQPFYMDVSFHAVHTAIAPRPDLEAKYAGIASQDPRHRGAKYAALTEGLDQTVGRILMALDDPDGDGDTSDSLRNSTVVMFYSDNGGSRGQTDNRPLRGFKGMFFEGGIRVPMTVRWPGVVQPGALCDEPVHAVDLYPTFAGIAGQELPKSRQHRLDGESFVKILKGQARHLDREALYWHFPGYMDTRQQPNTVINKRVNEKRYKLFYYYEDGRYELYNLTDDLGETRNLLAGQLSQADAQIASELSADMQRWLSDTKAEFGTWRDSGQQVAAPTRL